MPETIVCNVNINNNSDYTWYAGRVKAGEVGIVSDIDIGFTGTDFRYITILVKKIQGLFLEEEYEGVSGTSDSSFLQLLDENDVIVRRIRVSQIANRTRYYYGYKGGTVIDFKRSRDITYISGNAEYTVEKVRICIHKDRMNTALMYVIENLEQLDKSIYGNIFYMDFTDDPYIDRLAGRLYLKNGNVYKNGNEIVVQPLDADVANITEAGYVVWDDNSDTGSDGEKFKVVAKSDYKITYVIVCEFDSVYKNFIVHKGINSDYSNINVVMASYEDRFLAKSYKDEVLNEGRCKTINIQSDRRMLTFAAIADIHTGGGLKSINEEYFWEENVELFNRCLEFSDFGVILGDLVHGKEYYEFGKTKAKQQTKEQYVKNSSLIMHKITNMNTPIFKVHGNHGNNREKNNLDELNSLKNTKWNFLLSVDDINGVQNDIDFGKNYYYKDIENFKVRVIVLNQWEDRDIEGYIDKERYSNKERVWLAEIALDLSDKNNISEWSILIFQHGQVIDTSDKLDGEGIRDILVAFREASSVTVGDKLIDYGLINGNVNIPVIGVIHGHFHQDDYKNIKQREEAFLERYINVIGINKSFISSLYEDKINDDDNINDGINDTKNKYLKDLSSLNSRGEFLVSIFCIDTYEHIIYEIRLGRGKDRAYSYGIQDSSSTTPINREL